MGSSKSNDWGTPPDVLDRLYQYMGGIALDPCANARSIVKAKRLITLPENGLTVDWKSSVDVTPVDVLDTTAHVPVKQDGVIFVNPPYGREVKTWVNKCIAEAAKGAEIVLLTAARVDTKWFHKLFDSADAICFWKGRLKFIDLNTGSQDDPAFFPSALVYWGPNIATFQEAFDDKGHVMLPYVQQGWTTGVKAIDPYEIDVDLNG